MSDRNVKTWVSTFREKSKIYQLKRSEHETCTSLNLNLNLNLRSLRNLQTELMRCFDVIWSIMDFDSQMGLKQRWEPSTRRMLWWSLSQTSEHVRGWLSAEKTPEEEEKSVTWMTSSSRVRTHLLNRLTSTTSRLVSPRQTGRIQVESGKVRSENHRTPPAFRLDCSATENEIYC